MRNRDLNSKNIAFFFFLVAGLILIATVPTYAQSPVIPPGSGTQANPYLISEIGHLVWMSDTSSSSAGKYYTMTADIDASDTATWNDDGTSTDLLEGFQPIGTFSDPATTSFRGIFDGNGYTITGMVINRPNTIYVGLFGCVFINGQVWNLGMIGGAVTGNGRVGGLVGFNYDGMVSNCFTTVTVTGNYHVGGLVGYIERGTVSNCYATGAITGNDYIGGLVGRMPYYGTVSNCYATGAVTGDDSVGGLVGEIYSYGIVSKCYIIGAVAGSSNVGGLVGNNLYGTVSDSYWDVETSGQSTSDGGMGKSTAEMKQQATFAGWDYTTIWNIAEGTSYPWLRLSPPPFILTIDNAGPGSVTIDPASPDGTYATGTVVTLTAMPSEMDDEFVRWIGANPHDSVAVTVVMDSHKSVTVLFQHNIAIDSLADLANIGNDPAYPLTNVHYILTADIDASETSTWNDDGTSTDLLEGFKPIGAFSKPFTGIFDGNGHTITGLTINRPNTDEVGLFGYVGMFGHVRNLGMLYGTVMGLGYVGGLVGNNFYGIVLDCYVQSTVAGDSDYVGGLVGYNDEGTVSNCYATGSFSGASSVGGLVGRNDRTVSNCYATGTVTGDDFIGGLVGRNPYGAVSNCYASVTVIGDYYIGGLSGENNGVLSNCYANGEVQGYSYIGGFVGNNGGTVSNSYATEAVTGSDYVGGLVGYIYNNGRVLNSYATCLVTGSFHVGGLVGYKALGSVVNSYWDMETSGQSASAGGTGKSTTEMMQQSTFVGWDFSIIWGIVENVTYPYLKSLVDSDNDGIIDQIDACPNTIPGVMVNAQGCPLIVLGDFDTDGDVDLADLDAFSACVSGPTVPYVGDCDIADYDLDNDVDMSDFGIIQRCYSGENIPADPDCTN